MREIENETIRHLFIITEIVSQVGIGSYHRILTGNIKLKKKKLRLKNEQEESYDNNRLK